MSFSSRSLKDEKKGLGVFEHRSKVDSSDNNYISIELDNTRVCDHPIFSMAAFVNARVKTARFCGRSMEVVRGKQAHWAWFFLGEDFYAIIEYGPVGIVFKYFNKSEWTETQAMGEMWGANQQVYFNNYQAQGLTIGRILECAENISNKFTGHNYQVFTQSCRDFVREIGSNIVPGFSPPETLQDMVHKFIDAVSYY